MNHSEKQTILSSAIKAVDYINELDNRSVAPSQKAIKNLVAFDEELSIEGKDAMATIEYLHRYGSPATMASNGSRYFGFVVGGAHPVALAANWLATAWDQNAVLEVASPVSAKIESVVEKWLTELLPVAKGSGVGFVTGVTMANFCGLAAARSAILEAQGWDVESQGLFGAPPITVVVGEEVHSSLMKAVGMLGLGRDRVIKVPADRNGRMRLDALPPLDASTILCLQAGNVNTGGMDNGEIVRVAKAKGAWVHIDGAFGLWAGASEIKRPLTKYYDLADSWATDAHKWLNVPYDSGLVICRNANRLNKAMSTDGSYLDQSGARVPYQYTPEMSRRARAVDIWAVLRSLGKQGVDHLVTRNCIYAEFAAARLREAGFEVLNQVTVNQVLVSFGSNAETERVIRKIQSDGTCWCGSTVWRGKVALRISFSSIKTRESDVKKSLEAILRVAKGAVPAEQ